MNKGQLSKFYRIVVKSSQRVPIFSTALLKLAKSYVDTANGFVGQMKENGEFALAQRLLEYHNSEHFGSNFTFIDVGANVGEWTEFLVQKSKELNLREVTFGHLFELSPSTFETLKTKFAQYENLQINQLGLSNKDQDIEYTDFGSGSGVNTLHIGKQFHSMPSKRSFSKVIKGDSYLHSNPIERIDLLKIDVEGYEYQVLEGFTPQLESGMIKVIQFEYGYMTAAAGHLLSDFYTFLEVKGYIIGQLTSTGVKFEEFSWVKNDFKSGPNFVACKIDMRNALSKF